MAPLGVSFHLLIEDQGLVLSAILVPFDSNWFMLCPWAMSFFQKLCPAPVPPVTLPSHCGFFFVFGCGVSFFDRFQVLLLMVV